MKIVLLDDSDIALAVNSFIFTSAYAKTDILCFNDVDKAVDYITNTKENMIVLLDYYMPNTDGVAVYESIKAKCQSCNQNKKYILFSIDASAELKGRAEATGMECSIDKHGHRLDILNKVKSIENKYFSHSI